MKNISKYHQAIGLYLENGYINVKAIAERPTWLKVLIGARQVGKTYGVLKYHLDNNIPFILLRRTTEELKFIGSNSALDPFQVFLPEYRTRLQPLGGSYSIMDYDEEGNVIPGSSRGVALSLPQIAHIRGFSGAGYQSIVFDEAIPEKSVRTLKTEGDALLNAYTTINGNRELQGRQPITLWLLANSNNINSRILDALNLTDDIIRMKNKGLEYIEHDGISIFHGASAKITSQRKETALAKLISDKSEFAGMAYANEWSYDQSPLIKAKSLKGYTPLCSYNDEMYIWENSSGMYVCNSYHKTEAYGSGAFDTAQFTSNYLWLKRWYAEGLVTFSDIKLLALFKRLFELDY